MSGDPEQEYFADGAVEETIGSPTPHTKVPIDDYGLRSRLTIHRR